jgi:hypothetical protein
MGLTSGAWEVRMAGWRRSSAGRRRPFIFWDWHPSSKLPTYGGQAQPWRARVKDAGGGELGTLVKLKTPRRSPLHEVLGLGASRCT